MNKSEKYNKEMTNAFNAHSKNAERNIKKHLDHLKKVEDEKKQLLDDVDVKDLDGE